MDGIRYTLPIELDNLKQALRVFFSDDTVDWIIFDLGHMGAKWVILNDEETKLTIVIRK